MTLNLSQPLDQSDPIFLQPKDATALMHLPTKGDVDAAFWSDVLRDVRDSLSFSQMIEREAIDEVIAFLDPRVVVQP